MAWVRIDDQFHDDPDIDALCESAIVLHICGTTWCARNETDGYLPKGRIRKLSGGANPQAIKDLLEVGWWEEEESRYHIRSFLKYNLSKEQLDQGREFASRRAAMNANRDLVGKIRARDGDHCRYCGGEVNWSDRKGPRGGTYDHVVPITKGGRETLENIVVACRMCNSRKSARTLDETGMTLIDLCDIKCKSSVVSGEEPGRKSDTDSSRPGPGPVPESDPERDSLHEDASYNTARAKARPASKEESIAYLKELQQEPKYHDLFWRFGPEKLTDQIWNHYQSNGWKIGGKGAMKDWKAAWRNCAGREIEQKGEEHTRMVNTATGAGTGGQLTLQGAAHGFTPMKTAMTQTPSEPKSLQSATVIALPGRQPLGKSITAQEGIALAMKRLDEFESFCAGNPAMFGGVFYKAPQSSRLLAYIAAKRYAIKHGLGAWFVQPNGNYDFVLDRTPAQIQEAERLAEVARQRRFDSEVLNSGIPPVYITANLTTNSYDAPMVRDKGNEKMLAFCDRYVAEWKPKLKGILVSCTTAGCGKTYPLCAVGRALIMQGASFRYVKMGSFLDRLRDSYGIKVYDERTRSANQIVDDYAGVDVLLLDEIGREPIRTDAAGDWARSKVFELVDRRIGSGRTTFGTTNLTRSELLEHYDGPIVSRLHSLMAWVPVSGPDRRSEHDPFADEE